MTEAFQSFASFQVTKRGSANPPLLESTCDSKVDVAGDLTRGRYLHDSFTGSTNLQPPEAAFV